MIQTVRQLDLVIDELDICFLWHAGPTRPKSNYENKSKSNAENQFGEIARLTGTRDKSHFALKCSGEIVHELLTVISLDESRSRSTLL